TISPPAQNAFSPSPSSQTAAMSSSACHAFSCGVSKSIISSDSELRLFGAFNVATPMHLPLAVFSVRNRTGSVIQLLPLFFSHQEQPHLQELAFQTTLVGRPLGGVACEASAGNSELLKR